MSQLNPISKPTIREWPVDDRPREKLFKIGEHNLADSELLAILLRTGRCGESALDLARRILEKFKTFRQMSSIPQREWKEFKGLGPAKLAQVRAALEIGRRFREQASLEERVRITRAKDVVEFLMPRMRDLKKEVFKVIFLNAQNEVIAIDDIAQGTVNYASPVVREIFERALHHCAVAIICAHNHPSGNPTPSQEDQEFTRRLKEASKVMQITMLDHIIIGDNRYFSFNEEGTK